MTTTIGSWDMERSDKSGWFLIHAGIGEGHLCSVNIFNTNFISFSSVDRRFHSMTQECAKASAFINEDYNDYCNAWEERTVLTENLVRKFVDSKHQK